MRFVSRTTEYFFFALSIILLMGIGTILNAAEKDSGYITGTAFLDDDGTPMSGAFVYLFNADRKLPEDGVFWRAPDHIVGQLDRHGRFDVEVPVGTYYLTIIKRVSGKVWGPLQEGDTYYLHRVSAGTKKMLTIEPGEETNLGRLEGRHFAGRGVAGYPEYTVIAAIYGTLTNTAGKPVPGAYILVYREPNRLGPPLFSGGPSKADGSYNMKFYEEGTYYLLARAGSAVLDSEGPAAVPGSLLGRYGGKDPQPLIIKKDDVKTGIDIVLQPVGMFSQ